MAVVTYWSNSSRDKVKEPKILNKKGFQFILWVSGLRGGMALALALESTNELDNGDVVLLLSLIYSLFSILGVGSFLGPIFKKLKVTKKPEQVEKTTYEKTFDQEEATPMNESPRDLDITNFSTI